MALEQAEVLLAELFESAGVGESHGLQHAKTVMNHVDRAIQSSSRDLSADVCMSLRLAALLHDADDKKYFPNSGNYNNARNILTQVLSDHSTADVIIEEVIWMIEQVSTSQNGNNIPERAKSRLELLWPRWADRLDAIGWAGVVRCWQFALEKKDILYTTNSPRPSCAAGVWAAASDDRFATYQSTGGKSKSMIDHYYDKLLHLGKPFLRKDSCCVVDNSYLVTLAEQRTGPLVDVCLAFGKTGDLPDSLLEHAKQQAEEERRL